MDELSLLINCKLSLQTLPRINRTAHYEKILNEIKKRMGKPKTNVEKEKNTA